MKKIYLNNSEFLTISDFESEGKRNIITEKVLALSDKDQNDIMRQVLDKFYSLSQEPEDVKINENVRLFLDQPVFKNIRKEIIKSCIDNDKPEKRKKLTFNKK